MADEVNVDVAPEGVTPTEPVTPTPAYNPLPPEAQLQETALPPPPAPKPAAFDLYSRLAPGKERSHIDLMQPGFRSSLSQMLENAPPEVRDSITLNSGHRSKERQAELFAEAVRKYGSEDEARKWVAPPGKSQHNKGDAADLGFGNDAAKKWVHANAAKYGLTFPMAHEPWHIEPKFARVGVPADLKSFFDEASSKSGVPVNVLTAIAKQESSFNTNSVNPRTQATGIFNFIPSTWAEMMQKSAPVYGLPTTSSPKDARANILMGAEYARINGQAIKEATGRAPTDGEYYISHFLGTTGGINLIKANLRQPNAQAAELFPAAAKSNPEIFFEKSGAPRSIAQVHDFLTGVVEGKGVKTDVSGPIDFGKTIESSTLGAPPLPMSQAKTMSIAEQMAEREKDIGFFSTASEAVKDTITYRLLAGNPSFAPDNNYRINEDDLKAARELGVREDRLPVLGNAVSKPNFDFLVQQALTQQKHEQDLALAGWTGTGLQLTASLLDPIAVATGIASGGLADFAAAANGFGRAGRLAFQGIGGAASNVALDQLAKGAGDPHAGHNPLFTAALGTLFGMAFGAIGRNPYTVDEVGKMAGAADSLRRELLGSTSFTAPGSLGAAGNPHGTLLPFVNDAEWASLSGHDVPVGANGAVRFSSAGQLKTSPNPGARLAAIYGEDAVGGSKDSAFVINPISVSERAARRYAVWNTDLENSYKPAYDEWVKTNNLGPLERYTSMGRFGDEVTSYIRETDPTAKAAYHPAVKRAGDKMAALNKDALELAQNPLRDIRDVGKPVKGFDTVPENPNYMMRITDARKYNAVVEAYSEKGLFAWWKGAIISAQPNIDNDIAEAIARNTVRNQYKRANHIDEESNLMMSGFDQDQLKAVLLDEGIAIQRIEKLIQTLKGNDQVGADPRGKHRILLDENYRLPYPKQDGTMGEIKLGDFTVTDALALGRQYFRHMAGRVELAGTRIKNPTTGNWLVDGIASDGDHNAFKNRVKQLAGENGITDSTQTDRDMANMDWLYNRILGRPDPSQLHPSAAYLRLFRKFNFLRLMGQVGFAQIQDFSTGVAQLGLRAVMMHAPAFRRVINMRGESVLRHGLDREMEALMGRDPLAGLMHWRDEDFAPALPGVLGKIDNALEVGQRVMSKVSGLDLVNTALMRMMAKAVVQKFADLASKPTAANLKRMLSLDIDDAMLKRILTQTQHFTKQPGALFGGKVTHMNLHNWTDAEARAAFENGLFRWTRRVVQQNDYGAMHRWSSNPLWQMLFQFRSFALVAWEKQFLHNVQMRDWESFHMMWMSMALAAATYSVRTNVQAIGRSDREEFLAKRLAVPNLAGAAFSLAGWSSIMPMAWDTGMRLSGMNPWFDFRTTGQTTDALLGNPTVDFINSIGNAMKGGVQSVKDNRQMSQQEIRNWSRVAPFGNWVPVVPLLNSMIANRAPYAPKQ